MLYWLFFGSSALIGVYTLAGGTRLIQDTMTSLPLEPIYIIIMFQIIWIILGCFIDWIGILFLTAPISCPLPRSSASIRVARRAFLPQYADLLYLAAVRSRRVLSEGRDAARHHARADLRIDLALFDPSDRGARGW